MAPVKALPLTAPLQCSIVLGARRRLQICGSSASSTRELACSSSENEKALIDALVGIGGRGRAASASQLQAIDDAIAVLENSASGVEAPTSSSLIQGSWRLVFTTRPSSASPIQRTFVGVDAFTVFQEIQLSDANDQRVTNIVKFGANIGQLNVEAAASVADSRRINFRFDKAAFSFPSVPFKVPYPVPFRLLGDEAKGWLDTTYLSPTGNIRISRGNKGTTFVLQKELDHRQKLLTAIASGENVEKAILDIAGFNPTESPADLKVLAGKWKLLWTSQADDANWLQKLTVNLPSWQVIEKESGELENLVELFPGLRLQAKAKSKSNENGKARRDVLIEGANLQLGFISIPLKITGKGFVDFIYLDNKMRVSRGNKGEEDCCEGIMNSSTLRT